MPCQDFGRAREEEITKNYSNKKKMSLLKDTIDHLEAMLCAIVSELDDRNIVNEVIRGAENHGKMLITPWINQHVKSDKERLMTILNDQFSPQELNKIKTILNTNEG